MNDNEYVKNHISAYIVLTPKKKKCFILKVHKHTCQDNTFIKYKISSAHDLHFQF